MKTIETTDIYRSAYLLSQGGEVTEIRLSGNGRQRATFVIRGSDIDRADRAYQQGRALVNPVQLRECVNHVRDLLFDRLDEHEKR
jgi:hypothetical protein